MKLEQSFWLLPARISRSAHGVQLSGFELVLLSTTVGAPTLHPNPNAGNPPRSIGRSRTLRTEMMDDGTEEG